MAPSPTPPMAISAAENQRTELERLALRRPWLRVAPLADPVLSVGVGVRDADPMLERARDAGVPVFRRTTGGTGVLHAPGDLVWSLVLPREDPRIGPSLTGAYARLGVGVVHWAQRHGLEASWTAAPGVSRDCCLLGPRGRVLSVGERVFGGAAQHLSGHALLHHGVVPRAIDRARARALFEFTTPADLDRLVGTRELGIEDSPEDLAVELESALRAALALPRAPAD